MHLRISNSPGDLQQQFPFPPTPGDLWVLDTDYKTYSVVYSCQDNLIGTTEYGWILTRKPNGTRGLVIDDTFFTFLTLYVPCVF